MFGEMTKKYVEAAIKAETVEAINNHGPKYNSNHEAYAVLKEEVDEARDNQIMIRNYLFKSWEKVKMNDNELFKTNVSQLREYAENLALEAVQICAVCDKITGGAK